MVDIIATSLLIGNVILLNIIFCHFLNLLLLVKWTVWWVYCRSGITSSLAVTHFVYLSNKLEYQIVTYRVVVRFT